MTTSEEAARSDDEVARELAALRSAVEGLARRLDAIEGRLGQTGSWQHRFDDRLHSLRQRGAAAWAALRGASPDAAAPPAVTPAAPLAATAGAGLLGTLLAVGLGLIVLLLAVELVEEIFEGLRHLFRRVL